MQWSTHYSNLKLNKNSRGRYVISFYINGHRCDGKQIKAYLHNRKTIDQQPKTIDQ